MHLLVLTPLFPPSVGGASEDFRLLSEEWNSANVTAKVTILTERCPGTLRWERRGKSIVHRVLPPRDTDPNRNPAFRIARSLLTYFMLPFLVAHYLREPGSRVVLVHGRYCKRPFLAVLKSLGIKTVAFVSDLFTSPSQLLDCDAVICNSEKVYKHISTKLPLRPRVYHVPLPFTPLRPSESGLRPIGAPYFLFVGNISQDKGVDVLVEAFDKFVAWHPDYHLLLVGPTRDPWLNRSKAGVSFMGERSRSFVADLMQRAEAVVLPSRSESLPRVCLEAIALGTKVICPPGIPELQRVIPQWTLDAVTVEEVVNKMEQTLTDNWDARFNFDKHHPKLVSERILEVCTEICGKGQIPELAGEVELD